MELIPIPDSKYLAFPTVYYKDTGVEGKRGKKMKLDPFKIYAVDFSETESVEIKISIPSRPGKWHEYKVDIPSIYKVLEMGDDNVLGERLSRGQQEHRKILKWIHYHYSNRNLLRNPTALANVTKEQVIDMLSS